MPKDEGYTAKTIPSPKQAGTKINYGGMAYAQQGEKVQTPKFTMRGTGAATKGKKFSRVC